MTYVETELLLAAMEGDVEKIETLLTRLNLRELQSLLEALTLLEGRAYREFRARKARG